MTDNEITRPRVMLCAVDVGEYDAERSLDELVKTVNDEREGWEEFFDHLIKIHYTPESTFAHEFLEML